MLGVRERVIEQAGNLCPDVIILIKMLDPFQYVLSVTQEYGPSSSAPDISYSFSFPLSYFISCNVSQALCLECDNIE